MRITLKNGKVEYIYSNAEKRQQLIEQLKAEDYKVIKCKEYEMVGKPLPYDIVALNQKRDAIRDEINRLEKTMEHSGGEIK